MRMHILGAIAFLEETWPKPLKGLRAIEFGQLLAGPFTGTLLGDFGADVIKIEAPGDRRRDARLGPPAPQRPLAVVVDPGPQQALRRAQPARARGPADRRRPGRDRRHRARELPARHDGEVGPRARGRARPQPGRDLRPRVRLRPDRALRAPARVRVRRRGDLRPALHQRLPGPGAAALGHQPRRHARRAVGVPGHPARAATPASAAPRARSSTRGSSTPASR